MNYVMTIDTQIWWQIAAAGGWLLGGLVFSWLIQLTIRGYLGRLSKKTTWEGDDILIRALSKVTPLWGILIAATGANYTAQSLNQYFEIINEIIVVFAIFSVSWLVAEIIVGFLDDLRRSSGQIAPSSMMDVMIHLTSFGLGGLVILQTLGISITPILTALGVGGLAVALALRPTLENLFAGLSIILSQKVIPGDYIKLEQDDIEGYVEDIDWRNTIIRSLPNNRIIVPNSHLIKAIVTNFHRPEKELSVVFELGVAYHSDLERVEKITLEIAKDVLTKVEGAVPEFEPFIRYHTFADSSINFSVILRAREFVDQYMLKHQFVKGVKRRYDEENISIPFPVQVIVQREQTKK